MIFLYNLISIIANLSDLIPRPQNNFIRLSLITFPYEKVVQQNEIVSLSCQFWLCLTRVYDSILFAYLLVQFVVLC